MIRRRSDHLLLKPQDLPASTQSMRVVGVFNPAAVDVGDELYILARVAEAPLEQRKGQVGLPQWRADGSGIEIQWRELGRYSPVDPRVVELVPEGVVRLTFTSHLRLYRFDRRMKQLSPPAGDVVMLPESPWEVFGVEDPRITRLNDWYYITYVAVSPHGAGTALARTRDFSAFQRLGIIFPPENKDVVLFPEPINGRYAALHRPNPRTHFTRPEMWIAFSDNLTDWGGHQPLLIPNTESWQAGRIGGGAPPVRDDRGWLIIYHGNDRVPGTPADQVGSYFGAALTLDYYNPHRVNGHATDPVLFPTRPFETSGFVPNVVFPTAVLDRGANWLVVYGAADENVAAVELSKRDLHAAIVS